MGAMSREPWLIYNPCQGAADAKVFDEVHDLRLQHPRYGLWGVGGATFFLGAALPSDLMLEPCIKYAQTASDN